MGQLKNSEEAYPVAYGCKSEIASIELHRPPCLCPALKRRNDGHEHSVWCGQRSLTERVILHGQLELVSRLAFSTLFYGECYFPSKN